MSFAAGGGRGSGGWGGAHPLGGEEAVKDVHGEEEGVVAQLELAVHLQTKPCKNEPRQAVEVGWGGAWGVGGRE